MNNHNHHGHNDPRIDGGLELDWNMVSTRGRIESNNLNLVVGIPASFGSIDPQVSSMVIRGVSWDLHGVSAAARVWANHVWTQRAIRQRPARRTRGRGATHIGDGPDA